MTLNEGLRALGPQEAGGGDVFEGWVFARSGLEAIKLPSTLAVVPQGTFYQCRSLKALETPEGLRTVCGYAFAGCWLRDLALPSSLDEVRACAFLDNPFGKVGFAGGARLRRVGSYAFGRCELWDSPRLASGEVCFPAGADVAVDAFGG